MTAGDSWLIILGFALALVCFIVLVLVVKAVAERDAKNNRDICTQNKPCEGCVCGRGIGNGNLL